MGIPILIIGRSGTGKSRSLKFFNDGEKYGIIKAIDKPLPFKQNDVKSFTTSDYDKIKAALLKSKAKTIVIDDAGYLITNEFMARSNEKGYDKFNILALNFYELIKFIQVGLPSNKIVYIIMHEETDANTSVAKPKTIGKMLDEKICLEGMFTIVLRAMEDNGVYKFITNGLGAKSPEDMFEDREIENNLLTVDNVIRSFYELDKIKEE